MIHEGALRPVNTNSGSRFLSQARGERRMLAHLRGLYIRTAKTPLSARCFSR
jgi:hypothetical protein